MSELTDKFLQVNRARWNELAGIHAESAHYDLEGFFKGDIRIRDYERADVGDVTGKTLLHLMCHIGLDTLSWARLGARVTGADFSDKAMDMARKIAAEAGLEANFVCASNDELPNVLDERFDIVYTSRGVINWLPDIDAWARVVAHFVKPSGFFYITEGHPVSQIFDDQGMEPGLRLRYPYFHRPNPDALVLAGTYADPDAEVRNQLEFGWSHSLGAIITSLATAGLHIEFVREEPVGEWPKPFLVPTEDGNWRYPEDQGELPLWFSIKASKPILSKPAHI
jgi:SAM-dependent methyltransferase